MKCERCGSDECRKVTYYDTGETEFLCWDHRKDLILSRARQGTPSKPDPPESGGKEAAPDGDINRQSGISEFL